MCLRIRSTYWFGYLSRSHACLGGRIPEVRNMMEKNHIEGMHSVLCGLRNSNKEREGEQVAVSFC